MFGTLAHTLQLAFSIFLQLTQHPSPVGNVVVGRANKT